MAHIKMARTDEVKMSFITHRDTYCYTAMPFGLKNVGADKYTVCSTPPEHQFRCSIVISMAGSHGCRR
ncbi:hypothetical protein ACLOJK_006429 [Asimina triloba]